MIKIEEVVKSGGCYGCSACYSVCPQKCIVMKQDDEGFFMPSIDKHKCIECNLCDNVCIGTDQYEFSNNKVVKAYAGWTKNKNKRYSSTSGGIYSEIVEDTLKSGGNVYGVVYDKETKKVQYSSSDLASFNLQKKSKYVEAELLETYKNIRKDLTNGRQVVFSGTPCYVSGLKKYLGVKYDNLITCDFICHGRPSPKLFRKHLDYLECKYKSKIESIDFRPKLIGWSRLQHLEIKFGNKKVKRFYNMKDFFFSSFLKNISLRKSCMRCDFANNVHSSDITLADYWEYKNNPNLINDNQGISLILCNTAKGNLEISKIKSRCQLYDISENDFKYVFHERTDTNYDLSRRNMFFKNFMHNDYKENVKKFYKTTSFKMTIIFYIKNLLLNVLAFWTARMKGNDIV
jgi:coenzyme F420-reducing hydrogenase beta subunit